MTKLKFLASLEESLSRLSKEDRNRSIDFYSEMIDDHIEEGMSEEQAVQAVGTIDEITEQILKNVSSETEQIKGMEKEKTRKDKVYQEKAPSFVGENFLRVLGKVCIIMMLIIMHVTSVAFAIVSVSSIVSSVIRLILGGTAEGLVLLGAGLMSVSCMIFVLVIGQLIINLLKKAANLLMDALKTFFEGRRRGI